MTHIFSIPALQWAQVVRANPRTVSKQFSEYEALLFEEQTKNNIYT